MASSRRQLLEAEAELIRRGQLVAECGVELDSARGRMFDEATEGIPAWKLADFRSHLAELKRKQSNLAEEEERQRSVVAKSEAELDRAISGLNEASKQAKVMEKHRDAWAEAVRRGRISREQKLNDEAAAVSYERKRRRLKS